MIRSFAALVTILIMGVIVLLRWTLYGVLWCLSKVS